jgi:hypothetical protein
MRSLLPIALCGLAVLADEKPKLVRVVIETEKGNIELELHADKAPRQGP